MKLREFRWQKNFEIFFFKKTKLQDCLLIYWSTWLKFLYVALAMKLREFRCNTEKLRDIFKKKNETSRSFTYLLEYVYLFTGVRGDCIQKILPNTDCSAHPQILVIVTRTISWEYSVSGQMEELP
jgi:hypothetical protein